MTCRARGFTLVEMLVSAVITLVVCLLVAEMSMSMVGGVGTASGRVTAAQKLEHLRTVLANDLARLPQLDDRVVRLQAEADDNYWRLQLTLPARAHQLRLSGEPWERVRYSWERPGGVFLRQVHQPDGRFSAPEIIVSGVVELNPEFLSAGAAETGTGERTWNRATLPTFLRVHPHLTDVWEEGLVDEREAAQGRITRDYEALIPVAVR